MMKNQSKSTKRDNSLKTNLTPDYIDVDTLKVFLGQSSDCDYDINDDALRLLAQDLNYRLRYLIQESVSYMIREKQYRLKTEHIDFILDQYCPIMSDKSFSSGSPSFSGSSKSKDSLEVEDSPPGSKNHANDISTICIDICYPSRPRKDILSSDSSLLVKYRNAYREIIDLPEENFYMCLPKMQKISRDHQPIFLDLAIKSIFNNDHEQLLKILFSLLSILNCRYTNYNKITQILQDYDNLASQLTEICLTSDEPCFEASARILLNLTNNSFFGLRDNVCSTIINHSISILNDFANHNFDRYDRVLNILQIFIDYLDIYQILDSFLAHFGENSWAFLSDYDSFECFDVHLLNYTLNWARLLNGLLRKKWKIMDVLLFSKIAYFLSFVFGENFSNFFHDKVAEFTRSTVTLGERLTRRKIVRRNKKSQKETPELCGIWKNVLKMEEIFDKYTIIVGRKPVVMNYGRDLSKSGLIFSKLESVGCANNASYRQMSHFYRLDKRHSCNVAICTINVTLKDIIL